MEFPSTHFQAAVEELSKLPGVGKRTAIRLALHLLRRPSSQTLKLSDSLSKMVIDIKYCKKCHNISDDDICSICSNPLRNQELLCIVEDVRDVMAIENTGQYRGLYHVLGGKISPLDGIGPDQLKIKELKERIPSLGETEIVFALSATMEGDTTAYYLYKMLRGKVKSFSSIARGIGVGDELEFADELTLGRSITNRVPYLESLEQS